RTRLANALLMFKVPPTPVIVLVNTLTTPTSPGVPTTRPLAPAMLRIVPELIRLVWVLFVLPNCNEAIVPEKLASTVLLMFDAEPTLPVSKNFTSSAEAGAVPELPAVALVQLPPVDQFVSAPVGPLQINVSPRARCEAARLAISAKLRSESCDHRIFPNDRE